MKKIIKIIAICMCSILVTGLSVGLIVNSQKKNNQVKTVYRGSDQTYTQLYTHHFDVVLTLDQAFGSLATTIEGYGGASLVDINFNVMSNNSDRYETLSDMDGDGYIASAFGVYTVGGSPFAVFDARLVYDGNIVIYVTNMSDGSVTTLVVPNMSDFPVEDSVMPI